MLLKLGGGAGGSIEISNAPKITFNGRWLGWHLEFYNGILYWECWIFSSGVLTLQESYTLDAWGIGGGGAVQRADTNNGRGAAGSTNTLLNEYVDVGTVPVTVGAGANASNGDANGGSTMLGSYLTCSGGQYYFSGQTPTTNRNRFGAAEKNEHGNGGTAGDGWLPFANQKGYGSGYTAYTPGQGLGAGAVTYGTSGWVASPGALVIRIPVE